MGDKEERKTIEKFIKTFATIKNEYSSKKTVLEIVLFMIEAKHI